MVATHVDSPCLKIKPRSSIWNHGFLQVGVETYGMGLWHTWFDRDLGIAGRVMVRTSPDTIESRLVQIDEPVLRVPSLAVHYDDQRPFDFKLEAHLCPIAGTTSAVIERATSQDETGDDKPESEVVEFVSGTESASWHHHGFIVRAIAEKLLVHPGNILDFDLSLYDTQKAATGGVYNELIFSSRIDNLMMTFCGLMGLTRSVHGPSSLDTEESIRLISLFDNEEISSQTAQGGRSNFLPNVIRRLSLLAFTAEQDIGEAKPERTATAYEQTLARSFLISADMIHALHPNYPQFHELNHRPQINQGPVLFSSVNANFTGDAPGVVLIREIARRTSCELRLQDFVTPNGVYCGTTLGPSLSTALGVRSVDLGNCQLGMHSIREVAGTHDIHQSTSLLEAYFTSFTQVSKTITI